VIRGAEGDEALLGVSETVEAFIQFGTAIARFPTHRPFPSSAKGVALLAAYSETTIILTGPPIDQAVSWVTDVGVTV
jgi:hypothetical protein